MKQLSMRAKTIISFVLFAVVFTGLTLIASYCDLSISKILTKKHVAGRRVYFDERFHAVL